MDTAPRLRQLLFTGAWRPIHSIVPRSYCDWSKPVPLSQTTQQRGLAGYNWRKQTQHRNGTGFWMSDPLPTATIPRLASLEASDTHCSSMLLPHSYTRCLLILRVTNVLADHPGWTVNFGQKLLPYQRVGYSLSLGKRGGLTSSWHRWLNLIFKVCPLRNTGTGVPGEKSGHYVRKKMLIYTLQESQGLKDTPSWSDCQIPTCCLLGLSLMRITGSQLCQLIFLLRGEQTCLIWLYRRGLDLLYLGRFSQSKTSQKMVALVRPLVRQVFTWPSTSSGGEYIQEPWKHFWNMSKLKYNSKMREKHGGQQRGRKMIQAPILQITCNFSQLPRWAEIKIPLGMICHRRACKCGTSFCNSNAGTHIYIHLS